MGLGIVPLGYTSVVHSYAVGRGCVDWERGSLIQAQEPLQLTQVHYGSWRTQLSDNGREYGFETEF